MHMWDSTTCTCGAVKHVHVKQDYSPGKETFLSEKNKIRHRATVTMPFKDTSATEKIYP